MRPNPKKEPDTVMRSCSNRRRSLRKTKKEMVQKRHETWTEVMMKGVEEEERRRRRA
jgi:hypothetical protein